MLQLITGSSILLYFNAEFRTKGPIESLHPVERCEVKVFDALGHSLAASSEVKL